MLPQGAPGHDLPIAAQRRKGAEVPRGLREGGRHQRGHTVAWEDAGWW